MPEKEKRLSNAFMKRCYLTSHSKPHWLINTIPRLILEGKLGFCILEAFESLIVREDTDQPCHIKYSSLFLCLILSNHLLQFCQHYIIPLTPMVMASYGSETCNSVKSVWVRVPPPKPVLL